MILIQNIYYMLCYAFKALQAKGYKYIETEKFENAAELLAEILVAGLRNEIKRGLFKKYEILTDDISTIKGKINISETIKTQSLINGKIVCDYDEFTENTYLNQIIKTTLVQLLHFNLCKQRIKKIKSILVYFNNVSEINYRDIDWKIIYNKNNQNYRMLISICNLIIHGLIHTTTIGSNKIMDFIDEQKMSTLYEKFILEYYRKEHPSIEVNASFIEWQLDDDFDLFLPKMKSDISLSNGRKTLIIDAKYYSDNMQHHFERDSIISANIYQIFTYVKNKTLENSNVEVSGMLLYAKTTEQNQPNATYKMSGNTIMVRTLDLNQPFVNIKKELELIYMEHFQ